MSSNESSKRVKIVFEETIVSGPAEVNGTMAGVFITVGDAFGYAMTLEDMLLVNEELTNPFHKPVIEHLINQLRSCVDNAGYIVYSEEE